MYTIIKIAMKMNLLKKTGLCSLLSVLCSGGWIDPDTSISDKYLNSFVDKRSYELVFSDEFEKEGRFFNDGMFNVEEFIRVCYLYMCICTNACVYVYMFNRICMFIYIHMYIYIYIYIYVYIFIFIYVYIYIYMYNVGWDPKWTSMNKDDYTNYALQYYKNDLATTSNGYLNITTIIEDISYETNDILSTKGMFKYMYIHICIYMYVRS
jgi:hypothetical protein